MTPEGVARGGADGYSNFDSMPLVWTQHVIALVVFECAAPTPAGRFDAVPDAVGKIRSEHGGVIYLGQTNSTAPTKGKVERQETKIFTENFCSSLAQIT